MNLDNSQTSLPAKKDKKREVFINAYDQYIDQIYRFVFFKIGNKEEAQDLTSAIFLKTWNYIKSNKVKQKTLKALIYKIARNSIIDYYRSKNSAQEVKNIEDGIDLSDEKQNIERHIEIKLDIALIENNLFKLKDEYREVIILRFTEELSISEIADILDKTKGNTRVLIYRALKSLRELISQEEIK